MAIGAAISETNETVGQGAGDESKLVTPENLFHALLAWERWEQAACAAADVSRAAESGEAIDAAWEKASQARGEATSFVGPRLGLRKEAQEQRVIRLALAHARERAETQVRMYTADLTGFPVT